MLTTQTPTFLQKSERKVGSFTLQSLLNLHGETVIFKLNAAPLVALNVELTPSLFWGALYLINNDGDLETSLKVPLWLRDGRYSDADYWSEFHTAVTALEQLFSGKKYQIRYHSWDVPEEALEIEFQEQNGKLVIFSSDECYYYSYNNSEIIAFLNDYLSLLPGGWVSKPSLWELK